MLKLFEVAKALKGNFAGHFLLDFLCKQSVSGGQRAFESRSPLPASAVVPPRGCGGGGAMVRRDPERSHDMAKRKAQTSAKPRSATKTRSKVQRAKPSRHQSYSNSQASKRGRDGRLWPDPEDPLS